jgi:hypothetical protein
MSIRKMALSVSASPGAHSVQHWQKLYYEAVKGVPQVQIVWVVSRGMQDMNGKAIRGGQEAVIGVRSSRLLALELIEQADCRDPVSEGYRDYSIEDATVDRGFVRGVNGFCDGTWKAELAAERSRQPQSAPNGAPVLAAAELTKPDDDLVTVK